MEFKVDLKGVTKDQFIGFYRGWPNAPSIEKQWKLLQNSTYIVLAIDEGTNRIVGFITAISDEVLAAYIPLLEVLPEYQKKGIGEKLISKMREQLNHLYMVDLCCDDSLVNYYKKHGFNKSNGMLLRNYENQSGAS